METRVIRGLEALKSENGSQYSHGDRTDSMIVQTGRLSLGNALDMKGSPKEATIAEDDGVKESSNLPIQGSATENTADAAEAKKEAEAEKKK